MSTSQVFNASSTVQDVRDVFSGTPSEIMAYFFPSDDAAVNSEEVSSYTKSALLTAQAAEQTVRLATKAATLAEDHDDLVSSGKAPDFDQVGGKYLDHDDFKWVGSDKDPALLQKAQGTMMAAQLYLNTEFQAIRDQIDLFSSPLTAARSQGVQPVNGFKTVAADLYKRAAGIIQREGHDDIALVLKEAGRAIAGEVDHNNLRMPENTVRAINNDNLDGIRAAQMELGLYGPGHDPRFGEYVPGPVPNPDYQKVIDKIIRLTTLDIYGDGAGPQSRPDCQP